MVLPDFLHRFAGFVSIMLLSYATVPATAETIVCDFDSFESNPFTTNDPPSGYSQEFGGLEWRFVYEMDSSANPAWIIVFQTLSLADGKHIIALNSVINPAEFEITIPGNNAIITSVTVNWGALRGDASLLAAGKTFTCAQNGTAESVIFPDNGASSFTLHFDKAQAQIFIMSVTIEYEPGGTGDVATTISEAPILNAVVQSGSMLTLEATDGATLYVTTDGSTPTETSDTYDGPIPVSDTPGDIMELRVMAYESGKLPNMTSARLCVGEQSDQEIGRVEDLLHNCESISLDGYLAGYLIEKESAGINGIVAKGGDKPGTEYTAVFGTEAKDLTPVALLIASAPYETSLTECIAVEYDEEQHATATPETPITVYGHQTDRFGIPGLAVTDIATVITPQEDDQTTVQHIPAPTTATTQRQIFDLNGRKISDVDRHKGAVVIVDEGDKVTKVRLR